MPPPRRLTRRATTTDAVLREQIVAAAELSLARYGYRGVTASCIIESPGITRTGFYRLFANAEDALRIVIDRLAPVATAVAALEQACLQLFGDDDLTERDVMAARRMVSRIMVTILDPDAALTALCSVRPAV